MAPLQLDAQTLCERLRWEKQGYWMHMEAGSPMNKYPAKQHAQRVKQKLGVDDGLIYLRGEPKRLEEDSDMPKSFRQWRYFYYMSGCNEPSCHLTYDIRNDTLTLFIPKFTPYDVIWFGRGSTPAEALDKYDIDDVKFTDELGSFLREWSLYNSGKLYILHPSQAAENFGFDGYDSNALLPAMNLARVVKDQHEIELIRRANDISSRAHQKVLTNILKLSNETQVEGLFLDACVSEGAKNQAYGIIAASGPNAGTLHYDDNNEPFGDRQLMVLDAGCEWNCYASDITRTFPLSGAWPSQEAKDIYRLVERMQETCIQRLKPGARYLDVHIFAHQIAIDGLLTLGILHNGTKEEIYKAGTSKAFFPHGLGHHVGLEVHDVGYKELISMHEYKLKPPSKAPSLYPANFHLPVYDPQTCKAPTDPTSGYLEEGMIVTVEPGIYFSTYALNMFYLPSPIHSKYINTEVLVRYLPVGGVRIEDDILITSKGPENLTTAPKGEAMLDLIRTQSKDPNTDETRSPKNLVPVKSKHNTPALQTESKEEPLFRAPGIPSDLPPPLSLELAKTEQFEGQVKLPQDIQSEIWKRKQWSALVQSRAELAQLERQIESRDKALQQARQVYQQRLSSFKSLQSDSRTPLSCVSCRNAKLKCVTDGTHARCLSCLSLDQRCVYESSKRLSQLEGQQRDQNSHGSAPQQKFERGNEGLEPLNGPDPLNSFKTVKRSSTEPVMPMSNNKPIELRPQQPEPPPQSSSVPNPSVDTLCGYTSSNVRHTLTSSFGTNCTPSFDVLDSRPDCKYCKMIAQAVGRVQNRQSPPSNNNILQNTLKEKERRILDAQRAPLGPVPQASLFGPQQGASSGSTAIPQGTLSHRASLPVLNRNPFTGSAARFPKLSVSEKKETPPQLPKGIGLDSIPPHLRAQLQAQAPVACKNEKEGETPKTTISEPGPFHLRSRIQRPNSFLSNQTERATQRAHPLSTLHQRVEQNIGNPYEAYLTKQPTSATHPMVVPYQSLRNPMQPDGAAGQTLRSQISRPSLSTTQDGANTTVQPLNRRQTMPPVYLPMRMRNDKEFRRG